MGVKNNIKILDKMRGLEYVQIGIKNRKNFNWESNETKSTFVGIAIRNMLRFMIIHEKVQSTP